MKLRKIAIGIVAIAMILPTFNTLDYGKYTENIIQANADTINGLDSEKYQELTNEVLRLLNEYRISQGIEPVKANPLMMEMAQQRAKEQEETGLSHYRPDGSLCSSIFDEYDVKYFSYGENVAMGRTTPLGTMTDWKNSEGHNENMLDSTFTHVGIGVTYYNNTYYWVQLFAGTNDDKITTNDYLDTDITNDTTTSSEIETITADTYITTSNTEQSTNDIYFKDWNLIESDRYTGNMGDSFIDTIGTRNGNTTINNTTFDNGIEMWIARWNNTPESSWAWATYEIPENVNTFSGTLSVLEDSFNTSNFDTTIEIYLDDELAYSYTMLPDFSPQDINLDLNGASTIKISVVDNISVGGGTSFCIGNAKFSAESSDSTLLLGDVNCDNQVKSNDLLLLKKYLLGLEDLSTQGLKNADLNQDNDVKSNDLLQLKKLLLGLE